VITGLGAIAFTTFYNRLRWLDTFTPWAPYSLAVFRVDSWENEDEIVQEMEIDGPHANAAPTGVGHCAAGSGFNGIQYMESEAHSTLRGH
jgi:hypothetical protein